MKKRKILVFAHVPPPHHGQSVMVQILLDGLKADARFEVHHVDARVSYDLEDVGSFRPQKFITLFKCILQAWWLRLRHGPMAFYYVPAPAKRSAIMRDWMVMAFCRPLFPELILHWHAYGLGEWASEGNDWSRKLARWALGKADLSLVLNNYNKRDAEVFAPKRIEVVPNGIADQFPDYETALAPRREARAATLKALQEPAAKVGRWVGEGAEETRRGEELERVRFLFLGHLIETKGVIVAIAATGLANEELCRAGAAWRAHLTLAGSFASEDEKARVLVAVEKANSGGRKWEGTKAADNEAVCVELVGFLNSVQKKSALEEADCLVFPTFYEGETQGLVLLEAMSSGLPVITTSWRGVPEILPEGYCGVATPRSAAEFAQQMLRVNELQLSDGLRAHFNGRLDTKKHLCRLLVLLLGKASREQV